MERFRRSTLPVVMFFAVCGAEIASVAPRTTAKSDCFDLSPHAVNPEFLLILMGGGDVPNDAAVYFELPSVVLPGRRQEVLYCLQDIVIPRTVGGNPCTDLEHCWLAVGAHAVSTTTGVSAVQDYNCLCSGSEMGIPESSSSLNESSAPDACGLQGDESWALTCRDATNRRNYSSIASKYSSAYISICPEISSNCHVCQDGGGIYPSFVAGVRWVSNLQDDCLIHPFASYVESCSTTGFSVASIVGVATGGVLLLVVAVGGLFYHRVNRRIAMKCNGHQKSKHSRYVEDDPSLEERTIPIDTSPLE